jgi:hypothetical protein
MTPIRFLSMATSSLSNNGECFSGKLKKSIPISAQGHAAENILCKTLPFHQTVDKA